MFDCLPFTPFYAIFRALSPIIPREKSPIMYLEKLKDGRVRGHVQVGGFRKSAIWNTETEARRWGKKAEAELRGMQDNPPPPRSDFTFSEAVERYTNEIVLKKEGKRWEIIRLTGMLRYFGDVKLDMIKQPEIASWRDKRLEAVSGSSVKREKNLLSSLLGIARKEWHWMEHNPFDGVKMPKENEARTALWTWQKIRKVLRYLNYQHGEKPKTKYQEVALAFMIGLHTSLRASEILKVSKETLNVKSRVISVKTKTMKMAHVPITRRALKVCVLADFTINSASLDTIFRKARDGMLVGDLTFHDSRAFCLTMLARRIDVLTLSKISMHKDLKMLSRYYRETPEQIAGRLNK